MRKRTRNSCVPALRTDGGPWILDSEAKANLLAETFAKKAQLPAAKSNEYSRLEPARHSSQTRPPQLNLASAQKQLHGLKEDSSTGPDMLPTRILRECAECLAWPVLILANIILRTGEWPGIWLEHWIVPLYKKSSVFNPANHRGVHLTSQLSKVMERLIQSLYAPFLTNIGGYGPNQFAYMAERGARDVLAILALKWIAALVRGHKIGIYCSDVSGAFDRVSTERLMSKLHRQRLDLEILEVLCSWLRQRRAHVVVSGSSSNEMSLKNMIYQGTVLGPILWNTFFEDSRPAINECFFGEVVFADDLNSYRYYPGSTPDESIHASMLSCQKELHRWGDANQATFDPSKESQHIMTLDGPSGTCFKLLGVLFDDGLAMSEAVSQLVVEAGWKLLRSLVRTHRYYSDAELVLLYKSHLLGFLEYRTPAIYHATCVVLERLDRLQTRFLEKAGINEVDALVHLNLAPLSVRRDIAMLGMIHRTVLGKGPSHFKALFPHSHHTGRPVLDDLRPTLRHPLVKRSAYGLAAIYNHLPMSFVLSPSVKVFQRRLQEFVKARACAGCSDCCESLSPRIALDGHPVLSADVMDL